MNKSIDIGIITVIPTEIDAIFKVFGIDSKLDAKKCSSLDYWETSIYSSACNSFVNIAISFVYGSAGNTESAVVTALMSELLKPKIIYLVGIAAGAEVKVNIGDVVIPDTIHDVTVNVRKGNDFYPRSKSYSIDGRLSRYLKVNPLNFQNVNKQLSLSKPEFEKLVTTAKKVGLKREDFSNPPEIHDGSIISGNTLLRDEAYFPQFHSTSDERCRAGEMEASGFVRACEITKCPWVVVRGISDYGDNRKGDEFQYLAAKNASIVSRSLIEHTIDIFIFPRNDNIVFSDYTFDQSLEGSLLTAYNNKDWDYVVEIGSFLSRPLWLSGKYELRHRIGKMVENAAAYCNKSNERASSLIDDTGWTAYVLGNKEKAVKRISDGLRLAIEINDFYLCAKASRHLASIHRRAKEYSLSHTNLETAKKYTTKISNSKEQIEMSISLKVSTAKLMILNNKPELAKDLLTGAEQEFIKIGEQFRLVKIYKPLGDVYKKLDNISSAFEAYEKGYKLAIYLGRKDEALGNASSIALTKYDLEGKSNDAKHWADLSVRLLSELHKRADHLGLVGILQ